MRKRCFLLALVVALCLALTACSGGNSGNQQANATPPTCAEIVAKIEQSQPFEELTALSENQTLYYLNLNEGTLADMAMSFDASHATAEAIAVVHAIDESAAAVAHDAMQTYLSDTLEAFRSYQPSEIYKLENAIIKQHGEQVALVICNDPEAAEKVFTEIGW